MDHEIKISIERIETDKLEMEKEDSDDNVNDIIEYDEESLDKPEVEEEQPFIPVATVLGGDGSGETVIKSEEAQPRQMKIEPNDGCNDPLTQPRQRAPPVTIEPLIRSKKRKANPENWKSAVRKRLRQSGKEYINAKGNLMKERSVREGCGPTCHLKCSDRFSPDMRQLLHNAFWRLTDEQKNFYYWKYTSRMEPKRRRGTTTETSRRAYTLRYRFEVAGELQPVCSVFFLNTLDVTSRRIYYFYQHCYDTETSMPTFGTLHGKGQPKKPFIPDIAERLDVIRQHISLFPSVKLSGSSQRRYLAADLNLTRMYKMYKEAVQDPLKQHWYHKVFNEEFNLGFRMPGKGGAGNASSTGNKNSAKKIKIEKIKTDEQTAAAQIVKNEHLPNVVVTATATEAEYVGGESTAPPLIWTAATTAPTAGQPPQWNHQCIQGVPKEYPQYGWNGF